MNLLKRSAPAPLIKIHYRNANNHQKLLWLPLSNSENGILTVTHKVGKETREYFLNESDFYWTPKFRWQLRKPPFIKTWLVKEGFNGSIGLNGKAHKFGPISDIQLNTLLDTKVIQEFLLADILSAQVAFIRQMLLYAVVLALVAASIAGYNAWQGYESLQILKNLSGR